MSATPPQVWAVVPVKNFRDAKQRLSTVLNADQRRLLMMAMLEDVLTALKHCTCLAGVMLVTRDDEARKIAGSFATRVLVEDDNRGHTEAVTLGVEALAAENVASVLTVPADLPLVTPDDIAAIVKAHSELAPAVTIAPARDKLGSNAMLCSPPNAMPFRFGDDSFYPHLQRARDLGIEPRVIERTGLGLDIDTPDDLRAFVQQRSTTQAHAYLKRTGLVADWAGSQWA